MTTTVEDPTLRKRNIFVEAASDIFRGAAFWRLWTAMAWHSLRQRYKRTWIGIGWIGVSYAIFMSVKIFIFGSVMSDNLSYYAAHVCIGYLIFRLIANAVTGSSSVFVSAQTWIKSEPLPISVHVYQMMMNNLIIFMIMAIPAIAISTFFGIYNVEGAIWLLPALAMYGVTTVCVGLLLGVIAARYRDLMHFSATVMQVAYFLSPVLWIPPESGPRAWVAMVNPFTHYIAILRQPMVDGTAPGLSWAICGMLTGALLILALIFFTTSRRKLIFWL